MKLSRESRYAMQGAVYLAQQPPGDIVEVAKVAAATGLPPAFLAKIFRKLTIHGVLVSQTGRGYALAHPPEHIMARQIIEAIEGLDAFDRCVFWSDICSEEIPCPLHDSWKGIRARIADAMAQTSLTTLTERTEAVLPRVGSHQASR